MKFQTKAIHLAFSHDPKTEAVISPIHISTAYRFTGLEKNTGYDYSRSNNPTRTTLERTLAGIESAEFGTAFASGMAATDAILSVLLPGDEVVAARNLYGGTPRLFESFYRPRGINFIYIDGGDPATYRAAITGKTKFVWIETPTNPQLQILDIAAIAEVSRKAGVPLVVDNTFASPFLQRPIELGADIVLHSTTKYIAGHHDVIGGAVVTNSSEFHEKMRFFQNTAGAVPSPFDCYQVQRGIKTLGLRMRQHNENALALAQFLRLQPGVESVIYPGLEDHPQHQLAARQMHGFGGMVTFNLRGGLEEVRRFCGALKIFHFAESLGGTESLICHPTTMSHAVLSEEERLAAGITPQMIRVSTGLEDAEDLVDDLSQALEAARA